jgi:acyl homoserine lactone synthase
MIHYIYADQMKNFPKLADSMFRDRAAQFKHRLDWDVEVDENGWEVDQYDALNPLYIVSAGAEGRHTGSMRIMPSVGWIMTNEHFQHLTGGVTIRSPLIWECTRFCLSPGAGTGVAASLLAAGIELGVRSGLRQALGVVYTKTLPIYRRIGWAPDVIGSDGEGRDSISVGLWDVSRESRAEVARRTGITLEVMAHWYDMSFLPQPAMELIAA